MNRLVIPSDIYSDMLEHCASYFPDEGCGILAGCNDRITRIYKMTNIDRSPSSYLMDPAEQFRVMKDMRREGLRIIAVFHSHPVSEPKPSQKDRDLAFYDAAAYVIVGLASGIPEVRAFMIREQEVSEISVEVV
ncbi:MAG: M67 family metallopeptidase [Dissulfurispiraceae bacterium]|nr:M67 family metallopeptidase [Dissulfurispiraceae bacterium]